MFREFRYLQHRISQRSTTRLAQPLQRTVVTAPAPTRDPYEMAVAFVRAADLDDDEEAATLRRLRNTWIKKRLQNLGFDLWNE